MKEPLDHWGEDAGGSTSGFTLVEVLVSILILSMLTLAISLNLSLFLDQWQNDRMERRRDLPEFIDQLLLRDAVEGAYDYYVRSVKGGAEVVPYFRTSSEGFAFVTVNPMVSGSQMAVARVRVVQEGERWALIYEESSLEDKYLGHFEQDVPYTYRATVFDPVRSVSFAYYGAQDLASAGLFATGLAEDPQDTLANRYAWHSDYNGRERRILPRQVQIAVVSADGQTRTLLFDVRTWHLFKPGLFNSAIEE